MQKILLEELQVCKVLCISYVYQLHFIFSLVVNPACFLNGIKCEEKIKKLENIMIFNENKAQ